MYRTAIDRFGFTDGFDPTGESWRPAWGLYSELLLRTLMTLRHVAGSRGLEPVPDIAASDPHVSADGLTYTFHLKHGVKFGPPFSRDVTARDIEYAFERIDTRSLSAQYGSYYDGVIVGMTGAATAPAPISGIETPDRSTIVFHLQRPTGDFLFRLALPATAPIPERVARCFPKAGRYGRYLIASGPYMIAGEEKLDASSCDALEPISGFSPRHGLAIVRNPDYDPSTDSPELRANNIDGVQILVDRNRDRILRGIEAGNLDGSWVSPLVKPQEAGPGEPALSYHSDLDGRTRYLTMNMLVPPFDDVAVRRAVNFAIDKRELRQIWGGPPWGDAATHVFSPAFLDTGPQQLDPYATPFHAGDADLARREMARSRYDTNGDGVCDASVCRNVLYISRSAPPEVDMVPTIFRDLATIGLRLRYREQVIDNCEPYVGTVRNLIPITSCEGPEQDPTDPARFAMAFDSAGIRCYGQTNTSELGMTASRARGCGVEDQYQQVKGEVPSADRDIARCAALSGGLARQCWARFDDALMTKYVPWVPYLWSKTVTVTGPAVVHYEFDQFSGTISFCHIALANPVRR
ncbi:MAG: ABC transporter substrate-binding protein [Actinomycetota bacterium]